MIKNDKDFLDYAIINIMNYRSTYKIKNDLSHLLSLMDYRVRFLSIVKIHNYVSRLTSKTKQKLSYKLLQKYFYYHWTQNTILENDILLFEHYFSYFSPTQQAAISLKIKKDLPQFTLKQNLKKNAINDRLSKSLIEFQNNNYTPLKNYLFETQSFKLTQYHRIYKYIEKTDFSNNELSFLQLILEKTKTNYSQPINQYFLASEPSIFKNFIDFTMLKTKQKFLNDPINYQYAIENLFLYSHFGYQNVNINSTNYCTFLYTLLEFMFYAKKEHIHSIVVNTDYMLSQKVPFFKKLCTKYHIDLSKHGFSHLFLELQKNEQLLKKMKSMYNVDDDFWNKLLQKSENIFLTHHLEENLVIQKTPDKLQKI